ncbi:MAG: hypothetical protein QNJ91_07765 [Gammaproteobacteria bacterium]|nr:hypothetical protein [Gammaproteobacteria bacterium]
MNRILVGLLAVLICFGLGASMASAAPLSFSGSWTSQTTDDFNAVLIGPYGGSFAFDFDDAVVTGSGTETIRDIPLTSFTWTGTNFGGFDTTNAGGFVQFVDGMLDFFGVGGLINNTTRLIAGTNDFRALFEADGSLLDTSYVSPDSFGIVDGVNDFGTASVTTAWVPGPSALSLMGLCLAGIGFARNKKC